MTILDLERQAALAAEQLAAEEEAVNVLRRRLDAALARTERSHETRDLRDDLVWELGIAEVRAAKYRRRADAAREALELVRIVTAGRRTA